MRAPSITVSEEAAKLSAHSSEVHPGCTCMGGRLFVWLGATLHVHTDCEWASLPQCGSLMLKVTGKVFHLNVSLFSFCSVLMVVFHFII